MSAASMMGGTAPLLGVLQGTTNWSSAATLLKKTSRPTWRAGVHSISSAGAASHADGHALDAAQALAAAGDPGIRVVGAAGEGPQDDNVKAAGG